MSTPTEIIVTLPGGRRVNAQLGRTPFTPTSR